MAVPFDVANFNLTNFANDYNNIFDSTPADVAIQVKDSNGNVSTKTVANRGRFQQQVWDDVGGALGQFNKTVYVDYVNGLDTNEGTDVSPFKTMQTAVNAIPYGGNGNIILLSDYDFYEDVSITKKRITITFSGFNINVFGFATASSNYIHKFNLYASSLFFYFNLDGSQINFGAKTDSALPYYSKVGFVTSIYGSSELVLSLHNTTINLYEAGQAFAYNEEFSAGSLNIYARNYGINNINLNGGYFHNLFGYVPSIAYISSSIAFDDTTHIFQNVLKDVNGTPRNIVTNIVL